MDFQAADGTLEPLQYIHVQLQGGAPWGFTLQGGLEHGGPLIISKIKDGGKAANCEKIEVGDELVNINGTPIHGSRQEALILIKGSYKILKMIVRRRSVLVIRPHSWHLAKLSEVHPDVASMQYPTDAFSMSWHSGSEINEHSLQWNILSRHCSTDKSSSIGSMESLDQPGQNYYEGTILPLDAGLHQNKRDSAYSSFSASSNLSDYTVSARMDVASPINCCLGSNKQEDGRYLQTGQGAVDSQVDTSRQSINEHFEKMPIISYDAHNLDNINFPPQPPIRRDSLRENKSQYCNGERRVSAPSDLFHTSGMWKSEAGQFNSAENAFCPCTNGPCTVHLPENLSSDQYYMLTSESDKVQKNNKYVYKGDERKHNHCTESKIKWSEDDRETNVFNCNKTGETPCNIKRIVTKTVKNVDCEQWKAFCPHSPQTNMSSVLANFRTDLHSTSSTDCHYSTDECKEETEKRYECNANIDFETSQNQSTEQPSDTSVFHLHSSSVKIPCEAEDTPRSPSNAYVDRLNSSCITATLTQEASGQEGTVGQIKKPGSSRHRSAQMRRRSDRFATNLRNEIQKRKAQLQKSKDSKVLLSGEESVEEKDEAVETHSGITSPPPPPPKNKALILEIKRANAEKLRSSKDYLNQEKQKGDLIDKNNETHRQSIKENIPSEKEALIEDEELLLPSESQTYNEWWKSNAPDTHLQESLLQNRNQIDHEANTEQKCSYFIGDFQHAMSMAPKPESFLNEWARFSTSKPNSPDMWQTEDEISRGRVKLPVEYRDSLGSEQTPSPEVCAVNIFENAHDKQPPSESLDKHINVNNAFHMNNHCFPSERKWNSMQFTSELPVTERTTIYQPNSGHKKKVHDIRKSDDFSSSAQIKSLQHFSEIKNDVSQHNPNGGAKWIWSPEHNLQAHSYIKREIGQKLNGMNMEETVPPISKISDENVLMPFADRRKFFEDVSKGPTSSSVVTDRSNKDFCPNATDNPFSQTMVPDLRRHSVDHTHYTTSPRRQESGLPHCNFCMNHIVDPPKCCNHGQHSDYLPLLTYGYRACVFCANDFCPTLLKRNMAVTHHSFHCQHLHPHHHHQWTKCADYICPAQCNLLEEGGSLHADQCHVRKPLLQDTSLKEWNQHLKINRKCSQSVSDLCHTPSESQRPGSLKQCCEENNHEWSHCYKTVSSYDLSCENLLRPIDFASFQDGHPESSLSRNRAYSVSQLNLEYLALRDRMESPITKLEGRELSSRLRKKGPPRPPPPKWEKYREHKASNQTKKSGFFYCKERSVSETNRDITDTRQRSQSLPMDRTSFNVACNLSPSPIHGLKKLSEISALQGSQESLSAFSPSQNASASASKSTEAKECDTTNQLFSSETITMEPVSTGVHTGQCSPALDDIFEGGFRHSEDDWSTDRESEVSIPVRFDEFQSISPSPMCGTLSPTNCTSYYNTSEAKADLLNRKKEVSGVNEKAGNVTDADDEENELTFKKVQLIESISRKLSVLHEAQQGLQEDIIANATLGCELENLLKSVCKPNEYDKFRIFIGDLDKVVSLLLSLSGRLSRVESALNCKDPEPSIEEKLNLLEKKKQLTDQLEEAKELKAHVTRREQIVLETISKYLNDEQLQDYHHYVKMTSALIVEQRELEDKIRLGEEQLRCLRESL